MQSTCVESVQERGADQRVISMALYGDFKGKAKGYLKGVKSRMTELDKFYPNFTLRLYHAKDLESSDGKALCDLYCDHPKLDLCDTRNQGKMFVLVYLLSFLSCSVDTISRHVSRALVNIRNNSYTRQEP